MATFTAHVQQQRHLTHDVRELRLALDDPPEIDFAPGQFISFQVPTGGIPERVRRAYSIASPPSSGHVITLVYNVVPGGPGSSYLSQLQQSEVVRFEGPAGSFVLRDDRDRELLFVATGTGIAPFLAMLPAYFEGGAARRAKFIWGLRHERDLYYRDELAALAAGHAGFSYVVTLSQPLAAWQGPRGRVQRIVESHVGNVESLAVYLCGNSGMLDDVTSMIRKKGLCPIYREQYYRDTPPARPL